MLVQKIASNDMFVVGVLVAYIFTDLLGPVPGSDSNPNTLPITVWWGF